MKIVKEWGPEINKGLRAVKSGRKWCEKGRNINRTISEVIGTVSDRT